MKAFEHQQSAHCESGVIVNLLNFHGLNISEPLAFGIGSGLFFSHIPFLKLYDIPVTSYRILPSWIFDRVAKRLKIEMRNESFGKNHTKAEVALNEMLQKGIPVGMLSSVFYLPYLPKAYRFHFNAHNIVIFGRDETSGEYLVSDPVLDYPTRISPQALTRARFAKGMPEPKGRMYYPIKIKQIVDLKKPIIDGILRTANDMTRVPLPFFGIKGIRFLAKQIPKWQRDLSPEKAILYLGNLIRMQEEIGTGGAGFRFLYAAFLQESAKILGQEHLLGLSQEMTNNGDAWREAAFLAGRICKGRGANSDYNLIGDIIAERAEHENRIFRELRKIKL